MARGGEPLGAGTELATMLGGGGMGRSRATIAAACGVALMATGTHASEHHFWYNVITGETVAVSPLPTKHADPVSGSDYWAMPDGSTQWNRPTEMAWYKTEHQAKDGELHAEHDGREYYVNADTQESSWEVPPQFAWKRLNGETVYYFNTITGESQREKPEEMGHVDDETGRTYWIDKRTGEPTWESDHWWTEVTIESDDDPDMVGRTYWQQETTKEVQWDKPEVLGWVEWFDEVKDEL